MLDTPPRDQVTVEAETVEDALAEISTEFGEDAEIVRAQKVHRGGVGGFFAKEIVQLTARRRRDVAPPLRPRPAGGGIADVLERMAQDADAEDSDFRTVLQREMTGEPAVTNAAEFLAAVGWDDQQEDAVADGESAPAEQAEFVPPFAETETFPEPVAVGPALRSVPDPVDEGAATEDSEEVASTQAEVGDPTAIAEPSAGPVVPLRDPAESDLDEAASADPDEPLDLPASPVNEVVEQAPIEIATPDTVDEVATNDPTSWRLAGAFDAPAGMGAVSWSTTALLRLGLPGPVLSAVAGIDDRDDLGWIDAIAAAVAPHCGSLPTDNVIVVGPHAERLAEPLGLPLVRSGDMAPYDGSFCAMVEDNLEDRKWLEYVRGGRGIHLVVGDEPWQALLIDEPVAVSWVGETAVADALYLAFTLGATLGFGTVDGFVSSMVRAQPTDVALAVRRIVGRR